MAGMTRWLRYAFGLPKSNRKSTVVVMSSPALHPGAQIQLEGPGVARLTVEHPELIRDVGGVEDPAAVLQRVQLREGRTDEIRVDRTVDDHVRHVDALRPA